MLDLLLLAIELLSGGRLLIGLLVWSLGVWALLAAMPQGWPRIAAFVFAAASYCCWFIWMMYRTAKRHGEPPAPKGKP